MATYPLKTTFCQIITFLTPCLTRCQAEPSGLSYTKFLIRNKNFNFLLQNFIYGRLKLDLWMHQLLSLLLTDQSFAYEKGVEKHHQIISMILTCPNQDNLIKQPID